MAGPVIVLVLGILICVGIRIKAKGPLRGWYKLAAFLVFGSAIGIAEWLAEMSPK